MTASSIPPRRPDIRDSGTLRPGTRPYLDGERCPFVTGWEGRRAVTVCGEPAARRHYCAAHAKRMYAGVPRPRRDIDGDGAVRSQSKRGP